jgi:hypothetical protein
VPFSICRQPPSARLAGGIVVSGPLTAVQVTAADETVVLAHVLRDAVNQVQPGSSSAGGRSKSMSHTHLR